MNQEEWDYRFSGIKRLYGMQAYQAFQKASVLVVGIGGVGSWAAESLVRSGVGEITLMDYDDICVSNTNRQIHAMTGEVGRLKTESLLERFQKINPQVVIKTKNEAFDESNAHKVFEDHYDVVVDATDDFVAKFNLVVQCKNNNIPIVLAGAAGGRKDPTLIRVTDLSESSEDALLSHLRKRLRQKAGFPRKDKMKLSCVYSLEKSVYPTSDGCVSTDKPDEFKKPLDCSSGFGTVAHITASFGLCLSHLALEKLLAESERVH